MKLIYICRRPRARTTFAPTFNSLDTEEETVSSEESQPSNLDRPQQIVILGRDAEDGRSVVRSILDVLARNIQHPSKDEVVEKLKHELEKEDRAKMLEEAARKSLGLAEKKRARKEKKAKKKKAEEERRGQGLTFDLFDPFSPFGSFESESEEEDAPLLQSSSLTTSSAFSTAASEEDGGTLPRTFGGIGTETEEVTYFPMAETEEEDDGNIDGKLFSASPGRRREEEEALKHGSNRDENPSGALRGGGNRGKEEGEAIRDRALAADEDYDESGQFQDLEDFPVDGERVEHLITEPSVDDARRVETQIHQVYRDQEYVGTTAATLEDYSYSDEDSEEEEDRSSFFPVTSTESSSFNPTTPDTTPKASSSSSNSVFFPSPSTVTTNPNRARMRKPVRRRRPNADTTAPSSPSAETTAQHLDALRLRASRVRTRTRRPSRTRTASDGRRNIETFDGVSVVQIPAHLRKTPESVVVEPDYQELSADGK